MIFLQKGFHVYSNYKKEAIENSNSNEYINYFRNLKDLLKKIQLIQNNEEENNYFNEFTYYNFPKYITLFLDIDCVDNIKLEIKNYLKYQENTNILENLIDEILTYIYNKKIFKIFKNYKITNKTINLTEFLEFNKTHIGISKNINPQKLSYHIFFKKLIFNSLDIKQIKRLINEYLVISKHPYKNYIDTQVYKKNTQLRLIYSWKDNEDKNYHQPIDLEENEVEIDLMNLENYLFTYVEPKFTGFILQIPKPEDTNIDINNLSLDDLVLDKNLPHLQNLNLKKLFNIIVPIQTRILDEGLNFIKNRNFYNNENIFNINLNNLIIDFDYTKISKCIYCGKKIHKNKHKIILFKEGIKVIKLGNMNNCKILIFKYPKMLEFDICNYITNLNLVFKTINEILCVFIKKRGWVVIKENYSLLKSLLLENADIFNEEDIKTIKKIPLISLKNNFLTLNNNNIKDIYTNPYIFKFKNGILNIQTDEFIPMEQSKDYHVIACTDYNYKFENEYTDEEKKKAEQLDIILEAIIPKNDERNRELFERNISSSILRCHKNIITFFYGQTSAGKSTIKILLEKTLSKDNYIELPINLYTNKIDPSKPHASLGKISYLTASVASEPKHNDIFDVQNIKLLTEPTIKARDLYFSNDDQTNYLSQFIDTNFYPEFDSDDPAAKKRIAVINFTSYFKESKNYNLVMISKERQFNNDENLKTKILAGSYKLVFFNKLKKWAQKYHNNNLKMSDTSETCPSSHINNYINKLFFPSLCVNIEDIKDTEINSYDDIKINISNRKVFTRKAINRDKFYQYLIKIKNAFSIENINIKNIVLKIIKENKGFIPLILIADVKEEKIDQILNTYPKLFLKNFDIGFYIESKDKIHNSSTK